MSSSSDKPQAPSPTEAYTFDPVADKFVRVETKERHSPNGTDAKPPQPPLVLAPPKAAGVQRFGSTVPGAPSGVPGTMHGQEPDKYVSHEKSVFYASQMEEIRLRAERAKEPSVFYVHGKNEIPEIPQGAGAFKTFCDRMLAARSECVYVRRTDAHTLVEVAHSVPAILSPLIEDGEVVHFVIFCRQKSAFGGDVIYPIFASFGHVMTGSIAPVSAEYFVYWCAWEVDKGNLLPKSRQASTVQWNKLRKLSSAFLVDFARFLPKEVPSGPISQFNRAMRTSQIDHGNAVVPFATGLKTQDPSEAEVKLRAEIEEQIKLQRAVKAQAESLKAPPAPVPAAAAQATETAEHPAEQKKTTDPA
jgi:hypothetical protein